MVVDLNQREILASIHMHARALEAGTDPHYLRPKGGEIVKICHRILVLAEAYDASALKEEAKGSL